MIGLNCVHSRTFLEYGFILFLTFNRSDWTKREYAIGALSGVCESGKEGEYLEGSEEPKGSFIFMDMGSNHREKGKTF